MNESHSSEPCTSKNYNIDNADDDIVLNVKDDEAEIARLELPLTPAETQQNSKAGADSEAVTTELDDDRIPKIEFSCSACNMKEMVHYFGKAPPFVYGLKLLEDTFVLRDPFQPPPPRWKTKAEYFVALGSNCSVCQRSICRDAACVFYYTRSFCLRCAEKNVKSFPLEAQTKLRRQLSTKLVITNE